MRRSISLRSPSGRLLFADLMSLYPGVPTINLTGDDYRTVMWNAIMGYVDVDDAIEDLNTHYNEAYMQISSLAALRDL